MRCGRGGKWKLFVNVKVKVAKGYGLQAER